MARGRRLLGQLGLVLAVTAAGFLGAKLGVLGTREVGANHNFSDVPDNAFYHEIVQFLVDNGITAGCAPGLFCGEQAVTRGQTAVFLKKLTETFEIVRHSQGFSIANAPQATVTCPTGKPPLSGGGSSLLATANLFLTNISITSTSVTVQWETENDQATSGLVEAWALCAPA